MADEEAVTFEFVRKVQRDEQYSPGLTALPDDFYGKAEEYLKQKRKLAAKKPEKMDLIEVANIERLLEDIYNRRESKIVRQAVISSRTEIPPENLTRDEEKLFKDVLIILKSQRSKTLSLLLGKTKDESKLVRVSVKGEIPEFVGADTHNYGPFKKGDTVALPAENAKLLIKNGLAERSGED
ncbi:hypothetical protein A3K63_02195 [Candidatus Micrarchaeota archaeon RBG_16_49_10]|nr:MAG: hypothetical protein A3K63_02195 [Candidatus Micrarchaeota archaeon RBG_16_49_10]